MKVAKFISGVTPQVRPRRAGWFRLAGCLALLLAVVSTIVMRGVQASNPGAGTLTPASVSVTWTGTASGAGGTGGEPGCTEGMGCDSYTLTLSGQPADWAGKTVKVRIAWGLGTSDYDLFVRKGSATGPVVGQSAGGPPETSEEVTIDPAQSGTGIFIVRALYYAATSADQYSGTATVMTAAAGVLPAPQSAEVAPRYQNHKPQKSIITANKGTNAAEPSIGANWKTGNAMYISNLVTFRVGFDDSCPTSPVSTWTDVSAPTTSQNTLDPILATYSTNALAFNRTIVSQLAGTTSLAAFTDDDGATWTPSQGGSLMSGVDHQTMGFGPYHAPAPLTATQPFATYYCGQDIGLANCALSTNGGLTFGPAVATYNLTQCGGLHGHIKVSPDGTAYLPNSNCGGAQGFAVSTDNGTTWTVRTVPGSIDGGGDPSVGTGSGNRVYFGYINGKLPVVAVSDDQGRNWRNIYDVGAALGIKNAAFPAMVAGDNNRAAFAFYGSTTDGNGGALDFAGEWHLYIAHTYDGGATWKTVDATPNDPMQRNGIHFGGGSPVHRNLLDFFDVTVDKFGRVVVGYEDGCAGPACQQATVGGNGNSYSQLAAIARQSGGKGLFAASDSAALTGIPGAPALFVRRDGTKATISWSQSDNGGMAITNYKLMRGTASGAETFLTNIPASAVKYTDTGLASGSTYYYKLVATNAAGDSCGNNEVEAVNVGDSCTGLKTAIDRVADQTGGVANNDLDIQFVSVSEPYFNDNVRRLAFKLKVPALATLTANRQWRVVWNFAKGPGGAAQASFGGRYYIGMNTDASSVRSFEFGIVTNIDAVPASSQTTQIISTNLPFSTHNADGTITLVVDASAIGNPQVGDVLGGISGRTFPGTGAQTVRSTAAADTTGNATQDPYTADSYQLIGNLACRPNVAPTAVLTAVPTSGSVPLNVSFSGAGSSDPDAGDTIASYTFNFGDGSPVVTQAGATISHTYTTAGSYTASLTVTDSQGLVSANTATAVINAASSSGPAIAAVELGNTNSDSIQTLVGGCSPDRGLVRLSAPAPAGGQVVQLSSSNSAATVPASVTVAAGQTTAFFFTNTTYTPTITNGAITGMSGGATASQGLAVRPIRVRTVGLSATTVTGAQTVNGTATLECTAPATITINMVSSVPSVATVSPSTLTINSGSISAPFTVSTIPQNRSRATIINATTGGQTTGTKLTVNP